MIAEAADFALECDATHALMQPLEDADYTRQTQFKGWTINDVMQQPKEPTWSYPTGDGWYGENPYYRSFFWGVGNGRGDIDMVGVNGQTVRIAPRDKMVIVQFASWPGYEDDTPVYGWTQTDDLMEALIRKYNR